MVLHHQVLIQIPLDQVALRALLQNYLLAVIIASELGQQLEEQVGQLTTQHIPVYRLKDFGQYTYRCSVAFAAAKMLSVSTLPVAEQVWQGLCQHRLNCSNAEFLEFQVKLVSPGWLEFQMSHPLAWLNFVVHHPPQSRRCKLDQEHDLFSAQYAHARCCSLLRLARRQNLIEFNDNFLRSGQGGIRSIGFNANIASQTMAESLPDLTERKLLAMLMTVVDTRDSLSPEEATQHLQALGQGLLDLDAHCRIWGEVQTNNPQWVQARLVLLAGVQIWLRWLLETQLGAIAPLEL